MLRIRREMEERAIRSANVKEVASNPVETECVVASAPMEVEKPQENATQEEPQQSPIFVPQSAQGPLK